jgi:hypothetical protein
MMPGGPEPMLPAGAPPPPGDALRSGPMAVPPPAYRWHHKAGALAMAVFSMAIGIFLLIYPWTDSWNRNYFAALVPEWHAYWDNLYVRGAVSGLGIVNFYISLVEALRLRRFSPR